MLRIYVNEKYYKCCVVVWLDNLPICWKIIIKKMNLQIFEPCLGYMPISNNKEKHWMGSCKI
jgi:hypothetical protein